LSELLSELALVNENVKSLEKDKSGLESQLSEMRETELSKWKLEAANAKEQLNKAAQELAVERTNAQRLNQGPILPNVASAE
jgi:predicted nuclease with TOPRIM domain